MKETVESVRFNLTNPNREIIVRYSAFLKRFTIKARTGREKWQTIVLTESAAWCIYEGISALHPSVVNSSNKLWQDVRKKRIARTAPEAKEVK